MPVGTMTTGPSPRYLTAGPSSACWSAGPAWFRTASALAGAQPGAAAAALHDFSGARRRFELLGRSEAGVPVYDDYAHHPTEVAAVLAAARTLRPTRLVAVFQPHLFSRTRALWRRFAR